MKTLEVLELVLKGKRLKPKSVKNYCMAFGLLSKYSEEWPSDAVVINGWTVSLSGYADASVRLWFSLVNAAGKYMKKLYKLSNPCEDAERPKVNKKRRRYFTPVEVVGIIKACVNEFELLLVLTLIDSSCRIGELVSLSGKNVGDGFIDVVGKTGQRRYRLDSRLCERLRLFGGGDDKPVFKHESGGFYPSGDGLGHHVRRIVERAGITGSKLGAHTLRHSSASLVAGDDGGALIVKALLQHDDIKTSMVYVHDVEELVVRDNKYSPLRLLGKRYAEDIRGDGHVPASMQLSDGQVGESVALVPIGDAGLVEVEGASLIGDLFPEVKDGVAVRTVLRYEDLILIREAFVFYSKYHDSNNVARARALMRRMLRKGGSERYSHRKM